MLDLDAIFDPDRRASRAHSGDVRGQQFTGGRGTSGFPTKPKSNPPQDMGCRKPEFPTIPTNQPPNEFQIRHQVFELADWLGYPAVATETQDHISATPQAWEAFVVTAHVNNVVAAWIRLEDIDFARGGENVR